MCKNTCAHIHICGLVTVSKCNNKEGWDPWYKPEEKKNQRVNLFNAVL